MTFFSRTLAAAGTSALLLGVSVGAGEAMPRAALPTTSGPAAEVEQAAAHLHRYYPGYNSAVARRYRHMRRNSPNRFCRNQPSRCR